MNGDVYRQSNGVLWLGAWFYVHSSSAARMQTDTAPGCSLRQAGMWWWVAVWCGWWLDSCDVPGTLGSREV